MDGKHLYTIFPGDLKIGQRVYDVFNNKYGRIHSIKETAPEWIEPLILWDDDVEPAFVRTIGCDIRLVTE